MKKIILLAGLLLSGLTQAQDVITITTTGGAPITEGQVFTFDVLYNGQVSPHAGKLPFLVTNVSEEDIKLRIEVDAISNNAEVDNNVQLCFGTLCYNHVEPGLAYPNNALTLAPNGTNDAQDHFLNGYAGDVVGEPVVYVLKVVQYDDSDNEIATLRTFTYQYVPTMGTNEVASLESLGLTVNNTVIKNQLTVNASQKANVEIYTVNGQVVRSAAINEGSQSIDLSGLSAAVYIAKFTTANNQSSSIRIVKN